MGLPWFRLYTEIVGDSVIRSLAFEDRWHYVAVLCAQCDGLQDRVPAANLEKIMATHLGLDTLSAAEVKERLIEVKLIDVTWRSKMFHRRQFKSDSSTKRVRKWRERQELK